SWTTSGSMAAIPPTSLPRSWRAGPTACPPSAERLRTTRSGRSSPTYGRSAVSSPSPPRRRGTITFSRSARSRHELRPAFGRRSLRAAGRAHGPSLVADVLGERGRVRGRHGLPARGPVPLRGQPAAHGGPRGRPAADGRGGGRRLR